MGTFNFSLLITRPTVDDGTVADKLFAAGCDDGTFGVFGGVPEIEFDREAASFREAMESAIGQVDRAGLGSRVVRVTPDDLVNANAIAKRAGTSRQAVSLWIAGDRAEGFPAPRAKVGESPVWSWLSVAELLHDRGSVSADVVNEAKAVVTVNRKIEAALEPRASRRSSRGRRASRTAAVR